MSIPGGADRCRSRHLDFTSGVADVAMGDALGPCGSILRTDMPIPAVTTLVKCLQSPHALLICIEAGIVTLGQAAKGFIKRGNKLVKLLEKWGGKVIRGGKGSHTTVRMPSGRVEVVPVKPAKGTVEAIVKRALAEVGKS